jgi:hypothetical protein
MALSWSGDTAIGSANPLKKNERIRFTSDIDEFHRLNSYLQAGAAYLFSFY